MDQDAKANIVATEARRAAEEGRTVFAPMLNTPSSQSASFTTSGSISGWAEMIEAIEECGWHLEPRVTMSDASDVRAWWPACVGYEPIPEESA